MKHCKPPIRVSLLLTGDEIMAGDIVDTNSVFIAQQLITLGLKIDKKIVVGDQMPSIVDAINQLSKESDIVIMNGGLGATVDDLTAEAVANVTKSDLIEHPVAIENIKKRYGDNFIEHNPEYLNHLKKQAILPEGVDVIPNPVGLAVGFKIKYNNAVFYFTPGVPMEMKVMIEDSILPDIQEGFALKSTLITSKYQVVGIGESKMQQLIDQTFPKRIWNDIDLGFRAGIAVVEVKFSITKEDSLPILREAEKLLLELAPAETISKGESIQQFVVNELRVKGKKLIVIDGCTGGMLSQSIDSVSDSHEVFKLGIVANSQSMLNNFFRLAKNENGSSQSKIFGIEGVELKDLEKSCFIAIYCEDVLQDSRKTVTIHWGDQKKLDSRKFIINREKDTLQRCVSIAAIDMLRRFLLNLPKNNPYYFDELTRKGLR